MVTSTEEEKVPHGVPFWGVSDKLKKVSGKNENWQVFFGKGRYLVQSGR